MPGALRRWPREGKGPPILTSQTVQLQPVPLGPTFISHPLSLRTLLPPGELGEEEGQTAPGPHRGGAPRLHLSRHKGALSSVLRARGRPEAAPQPPSRSHHPQSAGPMALKPDPRGWRSVGHGPLKSHESSLEP